MIVESLKNKFNDWQNVTQRTVASRVLVVMRKHVGLKHAIRRDVLFEKVYGVAFNNLSLGAQHLLTSYLQRAIYLLRSKSNCFIATERRLGQVFFVVKDELDAASYKNHADARIQGFTSLKRRVGVAVKEQWHAQSWRIDGTESGGE